MTDDVKLKELFEFNFRMFTKKLTECDLVLPMYFWCNKDGNKVHFQACVSRRKKRKEGCVRCKQGKKVDYLMEMYNKEKEK